MLFLLSACVCISTYTYICIKPCFYDFWHYHPYILQHLNGNVFTVVLLYSPRAYTLHKPYPLSAAHVPRDATVRK